jgi:hypothetical protein
LMKILSSELAILMKMAGRFALIQKRKPAFNIVKVR